MDLNVSATSVVNEYLLFSVYVNSQYCSTCLVCTPAQARTDASSIHAPSSVGASM